MIPTHLRGSGGARPERPARRASDPGGLDNTSKLVWCRKVPDDTRTPGQLRAENRQLRAQNAHLLAQVAALTIAAQLQEVS